MGDVEFVDHGEHCCDERERPHVHLEGEPDGTASFRLARFEWRGEWDAVMGAVEAWLERPGEGWR